MQKIAILAPLHNFVGLYLCIDISSTCPHNIVNFGLLTAEICWRVWAHPCKFQQVLRLGSITAWHSSSGHQPNFAALNRGRHLYSAGRPSRWALAHILVWYIFIMKMILINNAVIYIFRAKIWFLLIVLVRLAENFGTMVCIFQSKNSAH